LHFSIPKCRLPGGQLAILASWPNGFEFLGLCTYNKLMNNWRDSWLVYSVGLFIVWAIVLLLVWKLDTSTQLKDVALIFYGYFVGWLSATIKLALIKRSKGN